MLRRAKCTECVADRVGTGCAIRYGMNTLNRIGLEALKTTAATVRSARRIYEASGDIVDVWSAGEYQGSIWFGRLDRLPFTLKAWHPWVIG